jgi:reactive intermediate/imine deaminase
MKRTPTALPAFTDAMHPYTPVRRAGDLLFVSGQLGVDARGELDGEVIAETRQALTNLRTRLELNGASPDDVVKVNVYLDDIADRHRFDVVYADFFTAPRPARSCVAARALPFGAKVEIEAIAYLPPQPS